MVVGWACAGPAGLPAGAGSVFVGVSFAPPFATSSEYTGISRVSK
jgi:hypothetical protein